MEAFFIGRSATYRPFKGITAAFTLRNARRTPQSIHFFDETSIHRVNGLELAQGQKKKERRKIRVLAGHGPKIQFYYCAGKWHTYATQRQQPKRGRKLPFPVLRAE